MYLDAKTMMTIKEIQKTLGIKKKEEKEKIFVFAK